MTVKHYAFMSLILGVCLVGTGNEKLQKEERQIPVTITASAEPNIAKAGESIPLTITIFNDLPASIYHSTFSLVPNDWNGETINISLVDIYRDNIQNNLYYARPDINTPDMIQGMGAKEVKAGGKLSIITNARKWTLRDGWLPGKYKITVRVDNLTVDKYTKISTLSEPIEFEIK
jgi:hypothetical protein